MKKVQWPVHGNRDAFARALGVRLAVGAPVIVAVAAVTGMLDERLVAPVLPLATGALMVLLLWAHSRAQRVGRREEVLRSFAGLAIRHDGHVIRVAQEGAFLGEFDTRRDAARAAIQHGRWAVLVHAWGRYYALAGTHLQEAARGTPFSFRAAAVADVVPSVIDDAISA